VGDPVPIDRESGLAMLEEYRAAHPHLPPEDEVAVECFGDSPALADELIAFVVDGPKRATAGLVPAYATASHCRASALTGWPATGREAHVWSCGRSS
jgi:hypothetical protein